MSHNDEEAAREIRLFPDELILIRKALQRYTEELGLQYMIEEEPTKRKLTPEEKIEHNLALSLLHTKLAKVLSEESKEVPETKLPEGVTLVKFEMKNEKYAEMVSTIFDAIVSGKYEFRSAVHLKDMFRTVMYKKGEKTGTPIEMFAKDKDNAWSLQQTVDWAYRGIIKVVATKREGATVEVAYIKLGLAPVLPKEKYIYSFKKTDGWTLTGEEK